LQNPQFYYDLEIARKAEQRLRSSQSDMVAFLNRVLDESMFYNSHTLHPRRLREIGREEAEHFLQFLVQGGIADVSNRSKQLALDGLGYKSMLLMCGSIIQFCTENLNSENNETLVNVMKAANLYVITALEGFIEEYSIQLKKDQLYIREAFDKVAESTSYQ
jgi:hypothetical protein